MGFIYDYLLSSLNNTTTANTNNNGKQQQEKNGDGIDHQHQPTSLPTLTPQQRQQLLATKKVVTFPTSPTTTSSSYSSSSSSSATSSPTTEPSTTTTTRHDSNHVEKRPLSSPPQSSHQHHLHQQQQQQQQHYPHHENHENHHHHHHQSDTTSPLPPNSPIKLLRTSSSSLLSRKRSLQNLHFHITGSCKLPRYVLPPWQEDLPTHWIGKEDLLKRCIMDLSSTEYTFRLPASEMHLHYVPSKTYKPMMIVHSTPKLNNLNDKNNGGGDDKNGDGNNVNNKRLDNEKEEQLHMGSSNTTVETTKMATETANINDGGGDDGEAELFQFNIHDGDEDDLIGLSEEVEDDDGDNNDEESGEKSVEKTKNDQSVKKHVSNYMRASLMLQLDPRLCNIRLDVARFVDETMFWQSYFYFIHVIRCTDGIQLVRQRVRELQERASRYCGESHTQKELGRQMKWAVQSVDQCISMVEVLLMKPASEITQSDIAHLQDTFQECVHRKMKISLLAATVSDELEKSHKRSSKSQKTLFDKMHQVNLQFQQLMAQYEQFLDYVNQKPKVAFNPELYEASRDPPSFTSSIQRSQIVTALPIRFRRKHWQLIYSTYENGISMATLLRRAIEDDGEAIVIVKTMRGAVFGGFVGTKFEQSGRRYYGNGETFLFSFANTDSAGRQLFQVYTWSKKNEFFIKSSDSSGITFGGGDDGKCGLYIDPTLAFGISHPCETFDSKCLNRDPTRSHYESRKVEDEDFDILAVEVWGFRWESFASRSMRKSSLTSEKVSGSMAPEGALKVSSTTTTSSHHPHQQQQQTSPLNRKLTL